MVEVRFLAMSAKRQERSQARRLNGRAARASCDERCRSARTRRHGLGPLRLTFGETRRSPGAAQIQVTPYLRLPVLEGRAGVVEAALVATHINQDISVWRERTSLQEVGLPLIRAAWGHLQ